MAQEQLGNLLDNSEDGAKDSNVSFKFNAQAPEFIPQSHAQFSLFGYYHPYLHALSEGGGTDWYCFNDDEPTHVLSSSSISVPDCSKITLNDDLRKKIIKQAEYQFSDMSLLANDSLVKQMNKDPEGFVPLSVISSTKKIKCLVNNPLLVAEALQSSSMLIVSLDCRKVKRRNPFTEKDKEEIQSRIVVAENLPEDHSYKNLEKIFSSIGRIKSMRICRPHDSNPTRPKAEFLVSNKLHALVEYETVEIAEKAAEKLNDERNWREGLRVRLLVRRSPKSVLKNRKSEFDGILDEEEMDSKSAENILQLNKMELSAVNCVDENSAELNKSWSRGQGKGRGRGQCLNERGLLPSSPQSMIAAPCESATKQALKGPRMPDGTRGFTMGRGKMVHAPVSISASVLLQ